MITISGDAMAVMLCVLSACSLITLYRLALERRRTAALRGALELAVDRLVRHELHQMADEARRAADRKL
jgi:hypothetical protein